MSMKTFAPVQVTAVKPSRRCLAGCQKAFSRTFCSDISSVSSLQRSLKSNVKVNASNNLPSVPIEAPKKRLAVFISGGGSNFRAINEGIKAGTVKNAEVALVVCDKQSCKGLDYANENNIASITYPRSKESHQVCASVLTLVTTYSHMKSLARQGLGARLYRCACVRACVCVHNFHDHWPIWGTFCRD